MRAPHLDLSPRLLRRRRLLNGWIARLLLRIALKLLTLRLKFLDANRLETAPILVEPFSPPMTVMGLELTSPLDPDRQLRLVTPSPTSRTQRERRPVARRWS